MLAKKCGAYCRRDNPHKDGLGRLGPPLGAGKGEKKERTMYLLLHTLDSSDLGSTHDTHGTAICLTIYNPDSPALH